MVTSAFSLVQMQPMMHNRFIFFYVIICPLPTMVFHPKSWATWASRYSRESVKSVDSLWLLIETMRYGCNSTNTITQLLAL